MNERKVKNYKIKAFFISIAIIGLVIAIIEASYIIFFYHTNIITFQILQTFNIIFLLFLLLLIITAMIIINSGLENSNNYWRYNMNEQKEQIGIFGISGNNINIIKSKFFTFVISALIIDFVIEIIILFNISYLYNLNNTNLCTFAISISFVLSFLIIFIMIKICLKSLIKNAKSLFYILDNNHFIIRQNKKEIVNITKNDIKSINVYKNKLIAIILNTKRKIVLNRYIDDQNELIIELNKIIEISNINKNPNLLYKILAGFVGIPIFN